MSGSSKPSFFKSLTFRLMGLAFCGTHVPLIAVFAWYMAGPGQLASPGAILIVILISTLSATVGTLYLVDRQIKPLRIAAKELVNARPGVTEPYLPFVESTELVQLFGAISASFEEARNLLDEKRNLVSIIEDSLETPSVIPQQEHAVSLLESVQANTATQIETIKSTLSRMRIELERIDGPRRLVIA